MGGSRDLGRLATGGLLGGDSCAGKDAGCLGGEQRRELLLRWPDFVPRARAGGIGSVLSTPLMATGGNSVGALNIYSRTERAFGPPEQELAALCATQVSRIVASAGVAAEQATRLQAALRVRELIAQAQGVVMARQGVSAEVASATLLRSSRQAHIRLRRQATEIVASTQLQVPLTGSEP